MQVKDMARPDTLSGDTCTPSHSDLKGDANGDVVTRPPERNQRVSLDASHLGSVVTFPLDSITYGATRTGRFKNPL